MGKLKGTCGVQGFFTGDAQGGVRGGKPQHWDRRHSAFIKSGCGPEGLWGGRGMAGTGWYPAAPW